MKRKKGKGRREKEKEKEPGERDDGRGYDNDKQVPWVLFRLEEDVENDVTNDGICVNVMI